MLSACFPLAVWVVADFAVVNQVWAVVGLDYSLRRFADRFPRFDHLCPYLFYRLYCLGFDRFGLAYCLGLACPEFDSGLGCDQYFLPSFFSLKRSCILFARRTACSSTHLC